MTSGFSVMTDKRWRGEDAKINNCMWAFAGYVARAQPWIAVFESVRSAYGKGRNLMQKLRAKVEAETGLRYDLWHVMHNARELGGAGERPRYFWVISRIPFGIEWPPIARMPVLHEVIGDLQGLGDTWQPQPYRRPPTWWSEGARTHDGLVDGHKRSHSNGHQRAYDLMNENGGWPTGWWVGKLAKHFYETYGRLPDSWSPYLEKLQKIDFHMGYIQMTRWDPLRPARVITGGALGLVMHPYEPRTITHREAARIMGFPDDWRIRPLMKQGGLGLTWGKGISVQCGEWMGRQVMNALDGHPGSITGTEIGERERIIWPPKNPRDAIKPKQVRVAHGVAA